MNEAMMPHVSSVQIYDPVGKFLQTRLVATCMNCKKPRKKVRVTNISREVVMCPDCMHALVWERIKPDFKSRAPDSHRDWLRDVRGRKYV